MKRRKRLDKEISKSHWRMNESIVISAKLLVLSLNTILDYSFDIDNFDTRTRFDSICKSIVLLCLTFVTVVVFVENEITL